MKRLFTILAAVCMAASVMAETAIQNTFMGLTLGVASRDDVQNVLNSQGFEFVSESDGFSIYQGNWQIEGVPVNNLYIFYMNDTLTVMSFANVSCEDQCDSLRQIIQANVENKYGLLQSVSSSAYINIAAKGLISPDVEQWSRMDNKTSFLYAKTPKGYILLYLAENYMGMQIGKLINNSYKKFSPDYAEENKVTGVAGVKFGDSKENVRKVIYTKAQDLLESDTHSLNFNKVKIGGITYDYATFYFAEGKGLVSVVMECSFNSWQEEEAKLLYRNIVTQYGGKYTNLKENKEGNYAFCGAYTEDYPNVLPIVISHQKSLSRGGDMRYYVQVSYFLERLSGMYDDEI